MLFFKLPIKIIIASLLLFIVLPNQAAIVNDGLVKCANIISDNNRLACYDKLAKQFGVQSSPSITSAVDKKLVVSTANNPEVSSTTATSTIATPLLSASNTADKKMATAGDAVKSVRENFGREHIKSKAEQAVEQLEYTVKVAKLMLRKTWRLTFTNGQVWQTAEYTRGLKFSTGDTVTIKRGVLTAFYLKKKGEKRSVRVKRIK
jgi:hypothetical protein